MKNPTVRLSTITAGLMAALVAAAMSPGVTFAADPPDPDLTGFWIGTFISDFEPEEVGEAAMRIDSQKRSRFTGQLQIDLQGFDLRGLAIADPPDPDADPPDPDADPPDPDRGPPDNLLIHGEGQYAPRMGIAMRGNLDRGIIVMDYQATLPDGRRDQGVIMLFRIGPR